MLAFARNPGALHGIVAFNSFGRSILSNCALGKLKLKGSSCIYESYLIIDFAIKGLQPKKLKLQWQTYFNMAFSNESAEMQ